MQFDVATAQKFSSFLGRYLGSRKVPDLAVKFVNASGDAEPKFIVEVGLSERYEDLLKDVKLWLEGDPRVSVVVIVSFAENPPFRCPTHGLSDQQFEQLQFPHNVETGAEIQKFIPQNAYGPVIYKDLEWVGRIETAFAEVWRRDETSGFASQDGKRVNLLEAAVANTPPPELKFCLSKFLSIAPNDDREISFDWAYFQVLLQRAVKQWGASRCQDMLNCRRGGFTELQDKDNR